MDKLQTLKGFRDFLPTQARKRQYVIDILRRVFESYGFEPLETPALEFAEVLKGKYGEDEKLIYEFKTRGGDEVALRYDQTVPLARVIAQYGSAGSLQVLPMPFRRYQIQPVWRGENPQKGRYREFLQCDADIVGSASPLADAEILSLVLSIYKNLGLSVTIKINDRVNFADLDKKYVSAIDKLEKIGESEVLAEMIKKGMTGNDAQKALSELQNKPMTENLKRILGILGNMGEYVSKIKYEPTLARGLDYYTGMIFETVSKGSTGSICSGGRWDKMIDQFIGQDLPAVGFGLGFDRTVEVLEENGLLSTVQPSAKVLVTIFSRELLVQSAKVSSLLRDNGISTELYPDEESKLDKQLKYADKKSIPYVIVIGPEEVKKDTVVLKNMQTGEQKIIKQIELVKALEGK